MKVPTLTKHLLCSLSQSVVMARATRKHSGCMQDVLGREIPNACAAMYEVCTCLVGPILRLQVHINYKPYSFRCTAAPGASRPALL